jgi:hypothetical protein
MKNEVAELSNDLNVITAEINSYKQIAGQAIFEIGRRLKHVKENDLTHGQFGKWLKENVEMTWQTANKFMQAYEQFGDYATSRNLPTSKIFELIALPPDVDRQQFLEQKHTIPSTGEQKTVDEMTVRELREVKKALKEERERRERAEREAEELQNRPPKIEIKTDEKLLDKLRRYEERYGDIDNDNVFRIDNATEVNGLALAFSSDVRELLRKYSHLRYYSKEILMANDKAIQEYRSSVEALRDFINEVGRVVSRADRKTIIEMEVV